MFYVCFDGYSETEFFPGGAALEPGSFDFSPAARAAFRTFLSDKYRTAALPLLSARRGVCPPPCPASQPRSHR